MEAWAFGTLYQCVLGEEFTNQATTVELIYKHAGCNEGMDAWFFETVRNICDNQNAVQKRRVSGIFDKSLFFWTQEEIC